MDSWTEITNDQTPWKYARLFRSLGFACLRVFMPSSTQSWCLCMDLRHSNADAVSLFFFGAVQSDWARDRDGMCWCLVVWGNEHSDHLLRGEVLKPATVLAIKKSAICLRASRPVGLFPFRCCSWIRLSNSSLKAWERFGETKRLRGELSQL